MSRRLRPCQPGECKRTTEDYVDWGIYAGCFAREGIGLSDVDGFTDGSAGPWPVRGLVEQGRQFLFIERKKDTDSPDNWQRGQEMAHARLAMLPGVTFITEILHADDTHTWRIRRGGWVSDWRWLTRDEAREWLITWSDMVEGRGPSPSPGPGKATDAPLSYRLAMGEDAR